MVKPLTSREKFINGECVPHPDGQPWVKCCRGKYDSHYGCQCFARKPHDQPSRLDDNKVGNNPNARALRYCLAHGERFFCVHRTTEAGYHRECAGWAALKNQEG